MKILQSFFQSVDEWVDCLDEDECQNLDCSNPECIGNCKILCIGDQADDSTQNLREYFENYIWN